MATAGQLDKYEENKRAFELSVKSVKKRNKEALPLAAAQLAVSLTDEGRRNDPLDITQREGFDSSDPVAVLSIDERAQFPAAKLVVDPIAVFVSTSFRLQNREAPRVHRTVVTRGRI